MSETKKCKRCGKTFPITSFSIKRSRKAHPDALGGFNIYTYRNYLCTICQRDYNREYMQKVRKAYHKSKGG